MPRSLIRMEQNMKTNLLIMAMLVLSSLFACNKINPYEIKSDYDVSIMSFNLRYDTTEDGENQWSNRKEACIKMLNKTKPSVFGIQEGLQNQVAFLDENLPQYAYVGVARDDGHSSGEYNAVFYDKEKFELLASETFWLSETPDTPSLGWDGDCRRIVTWAHLKDIKNNKTIYIFNTHFDHKGKTAREESGKLLVKKIKEIVTDDTPVFITGDFNALIRNPIFNPITKDYFSARRFAQRTDNNKSFNFFGRWYLSRNIDFVFYKNAYALSFRTVIEDYGVPYISDHYPIISHFKY